MKMLCYSLPSVHDHGCSVGELRRILRRANPRFFVINVYRLMDRSGPTSMVSVSLRPKKKEEENWVSQSVFIDGNEYTARPVWVDRRRSVFNMQEVLDALPKEPCLARKRRKS